MGLDTTHDAWHGPYSSFNNFRRWVAKQIGFDLDKMQGFGGDISFDTMKHDVRPLLDHSDCDGELTPDECRRVAKGLKEIMDNVPKKEKKGEWSHFWCAQQFRNGCIKAANANETIEFH